MLDAQKRHLAGGGDKHRVAVISVRQTQHVRIRRTKEQVLNPALPIRRDDLVRAAPTIMDGSDMLSVKDVAPRAVRLAAVLRRFAAF